MNNLMIAAICAKMKFQEFFTKEDGEVNIVAIVVLIGIAVLLALTFKTHIEKLLQSLFKTIDSKATNAINGTP